MVKTDSYLKDLTCNCNLGDPDALRFEFLPKENDASMGYLALNGTVCS